MKNKYELAELSVFEAVEALEKIARLPADSQVNPSVEIHQHKNSSLPIKEIEWLNGGNVKNTQTSFQGILSVVLAFLQNHYKKDAPSKGDHQSVESIKKIIRLVDEAAKKIDFYTAAFHKVHIKSMTQLKEYKQLQGFYRKKVVQQIDENVLGRWVLDIGVKSAKRRLESDAFAEHKSSRYLFVDLDALKQDIEYDLLFIRKEDGSHFFSPGLIRNMKLVCNLSAKSREQSLLSEIRAWQDNCMYNGAKTILHALDPLISRFYRDAYRFRHREIVAELSHCLMALMLCGSTNNIKAHGRTKSCRDYFFDFQFFLRQLLTSDQYHHLIANPPAAGNKVNICALELVQGFCRALFLNLDFFQFLAKEIQDFIAPIASADPVVKESNLPITDHLVDEYAKIERFLKSRPSGPLRKLLEAFEESDYRSFDPLLQKNFPSQLFAFQLGNAHSTALYLPSPTHQEYIHKAAVIDEFKVFLQVLAKEGQRHLLINLQDRTAWKEHARSIALEDLALLPENAAQLVTISLAKDTDFYHQLPPYNSNNQYSSFIEQF